MKANHLSFCLLRFSLIFLLNRGINSTNKVLPLYDLNEPAPTVEAEEGHQSPTVSHSQSTSLKNSLDASQSHDAPLSGSQVQIDSDCEIHHRKCKHWKKLTPKEKISAKNKRYRAKAVSNEERSGV